MSIAFHRESLPVLIDVARKVPAEVRAEFGALRTDQLNWKPAADKWSVGQCFDHLLTSNREYFPIFDRVLQGQKTSNTIWESLPGLPRFWGQMLIKSVSPDAARKQKAPKIFAPATSAVDAGIIPRFIDQQERVISYLNTITAVDADRIIITSPVARVITYSLLDACRVIVAHEQRHILQARRVTQLPKFPK
ncbi:MAG TPA: DinB family protein [Vicinamibacterales bacterium]